MRRSEKRNFISKTPMFCDVVIQFSGGRKLQSICCKDCVSVENLPAILESILHEHSEAASPDVLNMIRTFGEPTGITQVQRPGWRS